MNVHITKLRNKGLGFDRRYGFFQRDASKKRLFLGRAERQQPHLGYGSNHGWDDGSLIETMRNLVEFAIASTSCASKKSDGTWKEGGHLRCCYNSRRDLQGTITSMEIGNSHDYLVDWLNEKRFLSATLIHIRRLSKQRIL